jgi:hypothetical protein
MGANLITLEEYKEHQKQVKPENETRINGLITSISQLVKTYCGNSFVDYYNADKVETFTVTNDTSALQVAESPLISVSQIEERSSYSTAYTVLDINSYDYYLELPSDTIFRTSSSGFKNWAKGPGSVKITYRAGYTDTPEDLKLAIYDLVTYYFKDEYKKNRTLQGHTMSNETTSTQLMNIGFPDHIRRVLDLHRVTRL